MHVKGISIAKIILSGEQEEILVTPPPKSEPVWIWRYTSLVSVNCNDLASFYHDIFIIIEDNTPILDYDANISTWFITYRSTKILFTWHPIVLFPYLDLMCL